MDTNGKPLSTSKAVVDEIFHSGEVSGSEGSWEAAHEVQSCGLGRSSRVVTLPNGQGCFEQIDETAFRKNPCPHTVEALIQVGGDAWHQDSNVLQIVALLSGTILGKVDEVRQLGFKEGYWTQRFVSSVTKLNQNLLLEFLTC